MPSQRIAVLVLFSLLLLIPFASAQVAIEPPCKSCYANDCYSYKDCKPLKEYSCKTGNCCQGTCSIVPNSTDSKVNYIGDQMVEVMKMMEKVTVLVKKPTLTMHGTEYIYGQTGKVWLQLLDENDTEIIDAVCFVDIYNPDGTIFLEVATMTNMEHDGIYYYDIQVPEVEGVYPAIARCYYEAGQAFNFATSIQYTNSTYASGSLSNTYVLDGVYLNTNELTNVTPRRYGSELRFNNGSICSNISELLLTGVTVGWTGRWNSNVGTDVITISIYNYSSSSWIDMPNTITGVGTGSKTVANSFSSNNITKAGLVNSTGSGAMLKFTDTNVSDTSATGFDYDYLYISCDKLTDPDWIQIHGSSELHVSANYSDMLYRAILSTNETILRVNTSLYNHMTNSFSSLSSQISSVNQSISSLITTSHEEVMGKLADILGNITEVQNELYDQRILLEYVNSSMRDSFDNVDSQLSAIDGKIDDLENLIWDVNVSVLNKLYLMQDEIASVNNTVLAGNAELMAAIISTNETLVGFLTNISNITANITLNQENILDTLIALWGDSSGGKEVNMMGFTGLLTGLTNDAQYFCVNNVTLRSITAEVVNVSGKLINVDRTKDVSCVYGCVQNSCAVPNYAIYAILLGVTVFAYLAYRFYFRHDDSNAEY